MKLKTTTALLIAGLAINAHAAIVLNATDAWSPAIPADFNTTHTSTATSATITASGITVTASATGGVLEHFLNAFGVGTAAGINDGELSSGETLTFTFSQAVTLTSFESKYWNAGGDFQYTINGTTYDEHSDQVNNSPTTDSFTSITFNSVGSDNGGFTNLTFEAAAVPEPSSALLTGLGALAVASRRRK